MLQFGVTYRRRVSVYSLVSLTGGGQYLQFGVTDWGRVSVYSLVSVTGGG